MSHFSTGHKRQADLLVTSRCGKISRKNVVARVEFRKYHVTYLPTCLLVNRCCNDEAFPMGSLSIIDSQSSYEYLDSLLQNIVNLLLGWEDHRNPHNNVCLFL
jgi:hypothetical protein